MADDFTRRVFQRRQLILADRQLTTSAKVVGLHLLEYVNRGTKDAWPSQGRLAKSLGLCRRTVQNGLYQLAKRGHFKVDINRGRGCTNRYHPDFSDHPATEDENAQTRAHFEAADQKCATSCAGDAQAVAQGVRTPMRTNHPKELIEESSEKYLSVADMSAAFDEWWPLFPRHIAKGAARKAFTRIVKSKLATVEELKLAAMR